MKNELLQAMRAYFDQDLKRINHAEKVLDYAEQILAKEPGDRQIVLAAAIFHDIGIHAAKRKHGSTAGKFQEIEGPPIARDILLKHDFPSDKIDEVLGIIAHHHTPGKIETDSFKVLYDADWLVNIKDDIGVEDKEQLTKLIQKVFLTQTGRAMAEKIYLV